MNCFIILSNHNGYKRTKKSWPLDSSPSLDRINPKYWYIKWNIRIISNRANRIKSDASIEEIRLILKDAETLSHNL